MMVMDVRDAGEDLDDDNDGVNDGCDSTNGTDITLNHSVFAQSISSSNGGYDYSYGSPAHQKLKCDLPENYVYIVYRSASYGNTSAFDAGNIGPIYNMDHLQETGGSPKTSFGDANLNTGCGNNTCWDTFVSNGGNMHSDANFYSISVTQDDNGDGTVDVTITAFYNGMGTTPSTLTLYAAVTEEECLSIPYDDGSVGGNCWQSWLLNNGGYTDLNSNIINNGTGFETINLSSGQATKTWTVPENLVSGGANNMNVVAALYSDWNTSSFGADVYAAGDFTMTSYLNSQDNNTDGNNTDG